MALFNVSLMTSPHTISILLNRVLICFKVKVKDSYSRTVLDMGFLGYRTTFSYYLVEEVTFNLLMSKFLLFFLKRLNEPISF